jgi:hypothetical protein
MQSSHIEVVRWELPRLIESIHDGRLRIPDFQRDWVWDRRKVIALLDSIYREFPIGSFFFWRAPTVYNKYFRNIAALKLPPPRTSEEVMFILDGQQRITSLYVVSYAKRLIDRYQRDPDTDPEMLNRVREFTEICFDLDDGLFKLKRGGSEGGRYIPFCDLMDDDQDALEDSLTAEQRKLLRQCRNRFKTYPFSIIMVEDKTLDDVCDIFKRINQGGKRLSLSDLIVASTWSTDFNLREKIQADLNRWLEDSTFGPVEPEVITETLALHLRGEATQAAQLDLHLDEVEAAWPIVISAMQVAIRYFYERMGVHKYEWLPYRAMLPLLTYFFCRTTPDALTSGQRAGLTHWFWRSALAGRYSQAATSAMKRDRVDVIDALLGNREPILPLRAAHVPELRKLRIDRPGALKNALYCLLALSEPRDLRTNQPITLTAETLALTGKTARRVFVRSAISGDDRLSPDLALNIALWSPDLANVINMQPPSSYLATFGAANQRLPQALASHLLPVGPNSPLLTDDYAGFIQARAELVASRMRALAGFDDDSGLPTFSFSSPIEPSFISNNHHSQEESS